MKTIAEIWKDRLVWNEYNEKGEFLKSKTIYRNSELIKVINYCELDEESKKELLYDNRIKFLENLLNDRKNKFEFYREF